MAAIAGHDGCPQQLLGAPVGIVEPPFVAEPAKNGADRATEQGLLLIDNVENIPLGAVGDEVRLDQVSCGEHRHGHLRLPAGLS